MWKVAKRSAPRERLDALGGEVDWVFLRYLRTGVVGGESIMTGIAINFSCSSTEYDRTAVGQSG